MLLKLPPYLAQIWQQGQTQGASDDLYAQLQAYAQLRDHAPESLFLMALLQKQRGGSAADFATACLQALFLSYRQNRPRLSLSMLVEGLRQAPHNALLCEEFFVFQREQPPIELSPELNGAVLQAWNSVILPLDNDLQPLERWGRQLLLRALEHRARAGHSSLQPAFQDLAAILAEDSALGAVSRALLRRCYLCSPTLEALIRQLRARWLQSQQSGEDWPAETLGVLIAQQIWNSGYIYPESEQAKSCLDALCVRGRGLSMREQCLWALYRPLSEHPILSELAKGEWPHALRQLYQEQIQAPQQEQALQAALPALSTSEDALCAAFYGSYPYPRWRAPDRLGVTPLRDNLRFLFPQLQAPLGAGTRSLIVGCGTGQQLMQHALSHPQTELSGLDLSRSSLGYAARMLQQYPAPCPVQLYRGDLLDLPTDWHEGFDLIEAVGMLHHLERPEAGFQALEQLLKVGGILRLGFYGPTARRPVQIAQRWLQAQEKQRPQEEPRIRRLRLMQAAEGAFVSQVPDFYTWATYQDLLCHPREQFIALGTLANWLKRSRLRCLGPELADPRAYLQFRRRWPRARLNDFQAWEQFERERPGLFFPLTVFWLQKESA